MIGPNGGQEVVSILEVLVRHIYSRRYEMKPVKIYAFFIAVKFFRHPGIKNILVHHLLSEKPVIVSCSLLYREMCVLFLKLSKKMSCIVCVFCIWI